MPHACRPEPPIANVGRSHPPASDTHLNRPSTSSGDTKRRAEYWRRNIRYLVILLVIWFVVSFGFGILLAGPLDAWTIPGTGFPVGFWFAQQGAIYVFVALIFVYVWLMNRLDREFDVDEPADPGDGPRERGW